MRAWQGAYWAHQPTLLTVAHPSRTSPMESVTWSPRSARQHMAGLHTSEQAATPAADMREVVWHFRATWLDTAPGWLAGVTLEVGSPGLWSRTEQNS